ncbi:YOS1 [Symbiodinium pilosum]|uniref:YOS1 protein n=1 Tax=Symbiodinium pilosum TaxID=2952 RepID=A0A812W4U5_SYMPI|nr:YOS1 [Symbiodinium pilosum]
MNAAAILNEKRFLRKYGLDSAVVGENLGPKNQVASFLHAMRTFMRYPLVAMNVLVIIYEMILGPLGQSNICCWGFLVESALEVAKHPPSIATRFRQLPDMSPLHLGSVKQLNKEVTSDLKVRAANCAMPAPVTLGDEEIPQLLPKRVPRAREEREDLSSLAEPLLELAKGQEETSPLPNSPPTPQAFSCELLARAGDMRSKLQGELRPPSAEVDGLYETRRLAQFDRVAENLQAQELDKIILPCLEVMEFANRYLRMDALLCLLHISMGCLLPEAPVDELGPAMRRNAALLAGGLGHQHALSHADDDMVKVTIGKAEDPWCEIDLTEEDVEDWRKGVDITEEKLKEVIQLPPITLDNCHEREDGDLQWDEITFEEEVNGKYWHAVIMSLHRIREDFVKKQRKMKHLDWYMTMKKTSDRRNAKYYV